MNKLRLALASAVGALVASTAAPTMAAILVFNPLPLTQGVTSGAVATDLNSGTTSATFTDDFEFTLDSTYKTALTATFFNDGFPSDNDIITSSTLQIFQGLPALGASTAVSPVVSSSDPQSLRINATLSPGVDYYLEVANVIPAGDMAQYGVTATVAPVATVSSAPEPGTWALMFAGVAMIGGALRMGRRGSKLATA